MYVVFGSAPFSDTSALTVAPWTLNTTKPLMGSGSGGSMRPPVQFSKYLVHQWGLPCAVSAGGRRTAERKQERGSAERGDERPHHGVPLPCLRSVGGFRDVTNADHAGFDHL